MRRFVWTDISDVVEIINGTIVYESQGIGYIRHGMVAIRCPGFRIAVTKEYDEEGFVNKISIEKYLGEQEQKNLAVRAEVPHPHRPLLEVRKMQVILFDEKLLLVADKIVGAQAKEGNWSEIETVTGSKYRIDFNVKRIRQKLEECSSPPK